MASWGVRERERYRNAERQTQRDRERHTQRYREAERLRETQKGREMGGGCGEEKREKGSAF